MWNQSSGGSIGSLLQSLAQNNPQVFQAIMQMVSAQRQQGVGGIGSLMPRAGMSPRGDNSMIGGPMPMGGNLAMQVPPGGMPRTNGPPAYSGQPPQGGMWSMGGQQPNTGGGFAGGMGGNMGMGAASYAPQQTGPKYMPQQPYTQPTGPKYMPPSGPKTYGQTMPAEAPPSFSQPKPFPQQPAQQPMAGNGTTGLDWYAMQAGN